MDLSRGFDIEEPAVTVNWSVSEDDLRALLAPQLRFVTDKYWTADVRVLGNLSCVLGFHFRGPRGELSELEFFRNSYADQKASFDEFQAHFVQDRFGPEEHMRIRRTDLGLRTITL